EGTESISRILRMPVLRVIGQQSYLAGGNAAVRVIVTDSKSQPISGPNSIHIELAPAGGKPQSLFTGVLNRRGTAAPPFLFPAGLTGTYPIHYTVDTTIGSAEFTQAVHLEDQAQILLTSEKPLYQPGQTIHARALALDRANHNSSANRSLTFELQD